MANNENKGGCMGCLGAIVMCVLIGAGIQSCFGSDTDQVEEPKQEQVAKEEKKEQQERDERKEENEDWYFDQSSFDTLSEYMDLQVAGSDGVLTGWDYDKDNRVLHVYTNNAVHALSKDEKQALAEQYGERFQAQVVGILYPSHAPSRTAASVYFMDSSGDIWATSKILSNGFDVK